MRAYIGEQRAALNRSAGRILRSVPATVGIPLCLDARGRWRRERDYLYIDHRYIRAVHDAGALALLLPLQDGASAAELVDRVDGLLLPGGDDFAPERPYPDDVSFDLADDAQLRFDRALVAAAVARGRPILGICYGMQLLALEAGGALHHHVPCDVADALDHGGGSAGTLEHEIEVSDGSHLASWIGAGSHRVNSRHHQAVADAGTMRVVARARDGLIEAIEAAGDPLQLGVQWHPEALQGPAGAGLLQAFVDRVRRG